jgi:hypothetical protein
MTMGISRAAYASKLWVVGIDTNQPEEEDARPWLDTYWVVASDEANATRAVRKAAVRDGWMIGGEHRLVGPTQRDGKLVLA